MLKRTKASISKYLTERSVMRRRQYPTRVNTISSGMFIILTLPLAALAFPILLVRALIRRDQLQIAVLAIENEFAPYIELMEYLRSNRVQTISWDLIIVMSKHRHDSLDHLYSAYFKCRIIRSRGVFRIFLQVLFLQPEFLVSMKKLTGSRTFELPQLGLPTSNSLRKLQLNILKQLKIEKQKFVAMAVYSLEYDENRNPKEATKHAMLETQGSELVSGIDHLKKLNTAVILLGSEDTKQSRIPRDIPRLSQIGYLGGPHEVALASGCEYFWNDSDVGAWWLALPFKKPVLTTNKPRIRLKTDLTNYEHLVVPVRYQHQDGSDLTFKELLSMKSAPFKAASKGDILMIRNAPDEIVEAHNEMLLRVSGNWVETTEQRKLRERCREIFLGVSGVCPMNISSYFLTKYSHLLN